MNRKLNKNSILLVLISVLQSSIVLSDPSGLLSETALLKIRSIAPSASNFPFSLFFKTVDEAEAALKGFNYALIHPMNDLSSNQKPEQVTAIISGFEGSGIDSILGGSQKQSIQSITPDFDSPLDVTDRDYEKNFPIIQLNEPQNGQEAINALGDQLDDVAQFYRLSSEQLKNIFTNDSTAWIDKKGRMFYMDTHIPSMDQSAMDKSAVGQPAMDQPVNDSAQSTKNPEIIKSTQEINAYALPVMGRMIQSAPSISQESAFSLHSKPGANRLIYLDFTGHVVTNSSWNENIFAGSTPVFNGAPYDVDNNPGTFSERELINIKEIWQRVAEDFAPFNVDVTTQEPSADDLQRTNSSDQKFGMRVLITNSMSGLCNQLCGGIAKLDVYDYYSSTKPEFFQPVWVFADKLSNHPKFIADAASHELGHSLNLHHDGTSGTAYYNGHGVWGPIMGSVYYKSVTQWNKGEYPKSNNKEDDLAVMAASGIKIQPDDYANIISKASPIQHINGNISQTGLIETRKDIDSFSFKTSGGDIKIAINPDSVSPNLNVAAKLISAKGKVIFQDDPQGSMAASLITSVSPGTYIIQVEGKGEEAVSTGYSDYGSLGRYEITGYFKP